MLRSATALLFLFALGSTEFVPALVWQYGSDLDPVQMQPALHKVTTDNFRDLITKQASNKDLVLIFAEENLSVEDFNWQDKSGSSSFSKLSQLSDSIHSSFYSHVEDPMDGVLGLQGAQWSHIQLSLDLPSKILEKKVDSKFLLINMDDAADFEDRPNLLHRHDEIVSRTLKAAKSAYDRVLAVYTGHHTSWTPEEIAIRRVRSLLQAEEPTNGSRFINAQNRAFLYYSSAPILTLGDKTIQLTNFQEANVTYEDGAPMTMNVIYENDGTSVTVVFPFAEKRAGYWNLDLIQVLLGSGEEYNLNSVDIYAPYRFSYHCSIETIFANKSGGNSLSFTDFQIEPKELDSETPLPPDGDEERFNDAYDCVSFFTIPILSGIFSTIILIIILIMGLYMILDIKVMDRFDDPKGKTISVTNTD